VSEEPKVQTNAVDTKERREAGEREKASDRLRRERITRLLWTPDGRWLYHRMLQLCGVWSTSFVPKDPYETAYNEGKRLIGLTLHSDFGLYAPEAYGLMLKENPNA
jgi:hypothetical protein